MIEPTNESFESLNKASHAWCTPETESIEMDIRLAKAFARILDEEKNRCTKAIVVGELVIKLRDLLRRLDDL